MRACVRACVHECVHECVRACVHSCMRACVCACVHACMHACVRVCVRACVRACVRLCLLFLHQQTVTSCACTRRRSRNRRLIVKMRMLCRPSLRARLQARTAHTQLLDLCTMTRVRSRRIYYPVQNKMALVQRRGRGGGGMRVKLLALESFRYAAGNYSAGGRDCTYDATTQYGQCLRYLDKSPRICFFCCGPAASSRKSSCTKCGQWSYANLVTEGSSVR